MIGRLIFVFLSRFFLSALVARRVAFQLAGIAVAVAHVLILVIGCVRGRRLCGRFFHRGLLVGDRFGRGCILGLCFRLFRRLFLGRLLLVLAILASAQAEPRTALFAFSGFLCGGLLGLFLSLGFRLSLFAVVQAFDLGRVQRCFCSSSAAARFSFSKLMP